MKIKIDLADDFYTLEIKDFFWSVNSAGTTVEQAEKDILQFREAICQLETFVIKKENKETI